MQERREGVPEVIGRPSCAKHDGPRMELISFEHGVGSGDCMLRLEVRNRKLRVVRDLLGSYVWEK